MRQVVTADPLILATGSRPLGPALALRAAAAGVDAPVVSHWRHALRATAAHRLLLEAALREVAVVLGAAGVPWAPLKGMDLAYRVYSAPDERPTGDLDLLVLPEHLERVVTALQVAGWRPAHPGPRAQRFVREEGHNWPASHPAWPVLLEIHFRLWSFVAADLGRDLMQRSTPAPALGPTARQLELAGAYLVAAAHIWSTYPPRSLLDLLDLRRLVTAGDDDIAEQVISLSSRHDLDLLVVAAAAAAAELWPGDANSSIATGLGCRLSAIERTAARAVAQRGPLTAHRGILFVARLLSGRRSWGGWRSLGRKLWAHPGIVEMATPAGHCWPVRRLRYQLGWRKAAGPHGGL